ncbi:MAG: hypothetical protein LBD41_07195, partial [Clostridiales Family XIII bacterium]|nr:hypothetical protein [Clostridiales Family XIII bacterium]
MGENIEKTKAKIELFDDAYVLNMRKNNEAINEFIDKHMPLLYARASRLSKKYYTLEYEVILSVLMSAFHEAILKFNSSSGHFYPFVEGVMSRRVIDEFRKSTRKTAMKADISLDQAIEGEQNEDSLIYE